MKSTIFYDTKRKQTSKIVHKMFEGAQVAEQEFCQWCRIDDFSRAGFTQPIDTIVCLGILRGTGMAIKTAIERGINYVYLDHSYFDPGYNTADGWMRITVNNHTMNYVPEHVSSQRWEENFADTYKILPWRSREERGDNILILPPTHAVSWFLNEEDWLDNTINYLKSVLPTSSHGLIRIREKPTEPVVDKLGNLVGINHNNQENIPLKTDIENSNVVIAYNSMSALEATLMGWPVITSQNSCCYPISYSLQDINDSFDNEPDRLKLVYWLAQNQYTRTEIANGYAWRTLKERQGWL